MSFWVTVKLFIPCENRESAIMYANEMMRGNEMMTRIYDVDGVEEVPHD